MMRNMDLLTVLLYLRSSAPFPARQPPSRSQGSLSSGQPAAWRR